MTQAICLRKKIQTIFGRLKQKKILCFFCLYNNWRYYPYSYSDCKLRMVDQQTCIFCLVRDLQDHLLSLQSLAKVVILLSPYVTIRGTCYVHMYSTPKQIGKLVLYLVWYKEKRSNQLYAFIDLISIQRYGSSRPLSGALQYGGVPWTADFDFARPMWLLAGLYGEIVRESARGKKRKELKKQGTTLFFSLSSSFCIIYIQQQCFFVISLLLSCWLLLE
jgi:hypothetical protein